MKKGNAVSDKASIAYMAQRLTDFQSPLVARSPSQGNASKWRSRLGPALKFGHQPPKPVSPHTSAPRSAPTT
jgi:hypothetical protein